MPASCAGDLLDYHRVNAFDAVKSQYSPYYIAGRNTWVLKKAQRQQSKDEISIISI